MTGISKLEYRDPDARAPLDKQSRCCDCGKLIERWEIEPLPNEIRPTPPWRPLRRCYLCTSFMFTEMAKP